MEKNREKRSAPREQGPRGADLIAGRNAIAEALPDGPSTACTSSGESAAARCRPW